MKSVIRNRLLVLPIFAIAVACALAQDDWPFHAEEIATLDEPWAMAFLPDGRLL